MTRLAFVRQHRDEIMALAQRHGVQGLRVFGSVARCEDQADSDIDFLVTGMDVGRDLMDFVDFKGDLEQFFGQKVDVVFQSGLYWYVRDRILAEAIKV